MRWPSRGKNCCVEPTIIFFAMTKPQDYQILCKFLLITQLGLEKEDKKGVSADIFEVVVIEQRRRRGLVCTVSVVVGLRGRGRGPLVD